MEGKPADSWTSMPQDFLHHWCTRFTALKVGQGAKQVNGKVPATRFHLYQLFYRSEPTPHHPHHPNLVTPKPLPLILYREQRGEEATNKPGYVTKDKATRPDETDARAGVSGPTLEHCHIWSERRTTLPSQSESHCQSVQKETNGCSEHSRLRWWRGRNSGFFFFFFLRISTFLLLTLANHESSTSSV